MVRKLSLTLMICVLLVSALTFVSCKQEAPQPAPTPNKQDPVEDVLGTVSDNLVYNGDFEEGTDFDLIGDGSATVYTAGAGVDSSAAVAVSQSENYGQCYVDFTSEYGRGKSYLISASFKNNGSTNTKDLTARIGHSTFCMGNYAMMRALGKSNWPKQK